LLTPLLLHQGLPSTCRDVLGQHTMPFQSGNVGYWPDGRRRSSSTATAAATAQQQDSSSDEEADSSSSSENERPRTRQRTKEARAATVLPSSRGQGASSTPAPTPAPTGKSKKPVSAADVPSSTAATVSAAACQARASAPSSDADQSAAAASLQVELLESSADQQQDLDSNSETRVVRAKFVAGPNRAPFSLVSTVHEDEMYKTSIAKSELFTLTRREETHPYSEGKETEKIECDRPGVHAFMAAAGLDAAQCCWSATFSSGPSAQDCIDYKMLSQAVSHARASTDGCGRLLVCFMTR
jgi:hypothetical protein